MATMAVLRVIGMKRVKVGKNTNICTIYQNLTLSHNKAEDVIENEEKNA